jgi:hypothetical protein
VARPRRRRRKSSDDDFNDDDAEDDDECHHSSLADKASDYEDIWGTSPNQDESSSPPIVDAMEGTQNVELVACIHFNSLKQLFRRCESHRWDLSNKPAAPTLPN